MKIASIYSKLLVIHFCVTLKNTKSFFFKKLMYLQMFLLFQIVNVILKKY